MLKAITVILTLAISATGNVAIASAGTAEQEPVVVNQAAKTDRAAILLQTVAENTKADRLAN